MQAEGRAWGATAGSPYGRGTSSAGKESGPRRNGSLRLVVGGPGARGSERGALAGGPRLAVGRRSPENASLRWHGDGGPDVKSLRARNVARNAGRSTVRRAQSIRRWVRAATPTVAGAGDAAPSTAPGDDEASPSCASQRTYLAG